MEVYAAHRAIEYAEKDNTWNWQQERQLSDLIISTKGCCESSFEQIDKVMQFKILTDITNGLSCLGRVVESLVYYDKVLSIINDPAMAVGNKGRGLSISVCTCMTTAIVGFSFST